MPGGRRRKERPPRSAGSPSFRNRRTSFGVRPARTPLQLSANDRKPACTMSPPGLSLRHHRREQGLMLALASPALVVILLLVVLPVGWLAWQSIYHDGFTLENYRRIWSEDIYWRSFALTFEISLLVTLLALLLGYPIAYAASVAPKGWSIVILALVVLPFWTSVLGRAYAWLALLPRAGGVT